MTTLNDFKQLRASVPAEVKKSFIRFSPQTLMLPVKGWLSWQRKRV